MAFGGRGLAHLLLLCDQLLVVVDRRADDRERAAERTRQRTASHAPPNCAGENFN
jgi:hypothetical protein